MTIRKGPHPKHPCPKCAGRMIRETVGGRAWLECQNVDCGGRVLLDPKAPSDQPYQVPEREAPVRRGPRGPNRTPMSEESKRHISEAMRAAHARRKGLPAPARIGINPPASSAEANTLDRVIVTRGGIPLQRAAQDLHREPKTDATGLMSRMIETLEAQVRALNQKIETLQQAQAILGENTAA